MMRTILTGAQWQKMEPHCLGKKPDPGRTGGDGRQFLEAVLWIARTGAPWRDLPEEFGNWNTPFKRFRHWVTLDVFRRIVDAVSDEPDMEVAMVDGTIVKVHRHGQGSKGGSRSQAIGASRGGVTTKILALTDALGNLVRVGLLPGHRHDTIGVARLIDGCRFGGLIADTAFDAGWIVDDLEQRGAEIVISQHPNRREPRGIDPDQYTWRHLIENDVCKLKDFKRIALPACKTDSSFSAMIYAGAAVINSR